MHATPDSCHFSLAKLSAGRNRPDWEPFGRIQTHSSAYFLQSRTFVQHLTLARPYCLLPADLDALRLLPLADTLVSHLRHALINELFKVQKRLPYRDARVLELGSGDGIAAYAM